MITEESVNKNILRTFFCNLIYYVLNKTKEYITYFIPEKKRVYIT